MRLSAKVRDGFFLWPYLIKRVWLVGVSKYWWKTFCIAVFLNSLFRFLKQLTCVCEAEALISSRSVAVELQPQAIGCTIDDMTHDAITCKVAKETGWSVLSIIHLSIKTKEQDRRAWIKTWVKRFVWFCRRLWECTSTSYGNENIAAHVFTVRCWPGVVCKQNMEKKI